MNRQEIIDTVYWFCLSALVSALFVGFLTGKLS